MGVNCVGGERVHKKLLCFFGEVPPSRFVVGLTGEDGEKRYLKTLDRGSECLTCLLNEQCVPCPGHATFLSLSFFIYDNRDGKDYPSIFRIG